MKAAGKLPGWQAALAFPALLALLVPLGLPAGAAPPGTQPGPAAPPIPGENRVVLMHTNDLHSHLLGVPETDYDPLGPGDDGTVGGFARLATRIRETRAAAESQGIPALLVDAGDFSMGTLFHLLGGEAELGLMRRVGYDFACLGNHEFDWLPPGMAGIVGHAGGLPLLCANLEVGDTGNAGGRAVQKLLDSGRVLPHKFKDLRNGVRAGVFGLMGKNASHVLYRPDPRLYPLEFRNAVQAARNTVALLRDTLNADLIVCLSHSGFARDNPARGEDPELARAVPGIDVIVSGHTHTFLPEPVVTPNGTLIVQAFEYAKVLGALGLERVDGRWRQTSYEYMQIDDRVPGDADTQGLVERYIDKIDREYLHPRGTAFRRQIAGTDFDLIKASGQECTLGNLVTDAIRWSVDQEENVPGHPREGPVAFAVESNGVIRDDILRGRQGRISVSDAFRVVPLGHDPTARPGMDQAGYPLLSFYLFPHEIRQAAEVNATAYYLLKDTDYWLSCSGLQFTYFSKAFPFMRVREVRRCTRPVDLDPECQETARLHTNNADRTLFKVACNYYVGLNIQTLKQKSRGILDIVPKDARGNPIADLRDAIVRQADGTSLKQFEGFLRYLASFPPNQEGIPVIPERYRQPQGRIADGCFVATAAYGSPLAPGVELLREFRDRILAKSEAGRWFIALYYRYGPYIARLVEESEGRKGAVRLLLLPVLGAARALLWLS